MYYVKWKRKEEYLKPNGTEIGVFPWGSLKEAKSFASTLEATAFINVGGCRHWLATTDIVFIHPLNFEQRIKRTG